MSGPPAWLVKGSDELLRDRVVDELVAELLSGDDRSFALEEITVPGRTSDDPDAPGGAEGREHAVATVLNAAGSPPFINTGRKVISQHDYLFDAGSGLVGFCNNSTP